MASCGARQQGGKAHSPAPAGMNGGKRKTARRGKKTARKGKGKSKGKRKTARKSFLARLFKF
jgi:hypothetical protein